MSHRHGAETRQPVDRSEIVFDPRHSLPEIKGKRSLNFQVKMTSGDAQAGAWGGMIRNDGHPSNFRGVQTFRSRSGHLVNCCFHISSHTVTSIHRPMVDRRDRSQQMTGWRRAAYRITRVGRWHASRLHWSIINTVSGRLAGFRSVIRLDPDLAWQFSGLMPLALTDAEAEVKSLFFNSNDTLAESKT